MADQRRMTKEEREWVTGDRWTEAQQRMMEKGKADAKAEVQRRRTDSSDKQ